MTPTGIYAPGTGGKGTGLHPVDTRDANSQNLSRESLIRPSHRPTDPPPVTDQLAAHYAARLESVYTDGDSVGRLADFFGPNDLTQATSSKKPTYRDNATDNIGGHPVIDGDGSDDFLNNTDAVWADVNSVHTVFVVVRPSAAATGQFGYSLLTSGDFGGTGAGLLPNDTASGSGGARLRVDGSNVISENGSDLSGTPVIYSQVADEGGDYRTRRDGSQVGSSTSTFTLNDAGQLGLFGVDGSNNFNGDIAEFLIYSRILSDTEISDVETWLNNTVGYGIF